MHLYVSGMWLSSPATLLLDPAAAMGLVQCAVEWDEVLHCVCAVPYVGQDLMSPLTNTALPTASLGQRNSCLITVALIVTAQISLAAF